jgi:Flp pilus assembly protein TadG
MRPGRRSGTDQGSVSVYVAVLAFPFLLVAGLVVDGSGALVARQRAADEAEQAARAGANQIDLATLRAPGGVRRIDDAAAQEAVDTYFSLVRHSATDTHDPAVVSHAPERVTVTVHVTYAPIVLTGLPRSFTQTASAVPLSK